MIHYTLVCDQRHEFDGWFRGSAGFDEQKRLGVLVCPECGSTDVSKGIMAPNVATGADDRDDKRPATPSEHVARRSQMRQFVADLRAHVERTCDYVGERFPDEARRLHNGESERRNIYGEATLEEAKALTEEGVPIAPLPPIPNSDN
jgi:hypothetical protein